jgi:hypothetical protein
VAGVRYPITQHGAPIRVGVRSIQTGNYNGVLENWTQEHAKRQAARIRQGHDPLSRITDFMQYFPGFEVTEIVAESWPENSEKESAVEMWHSWQQSPGHWSVADGRVYHWGYSMAMGRNGVWYAAGLAVIDPSWGEGECPTGFVESVYLRRASVRGAPPPSPVPAHYSP